MFLSLIDCNSNLSRKKTSQNPMRNHFIFSYFFGLNTCAVQCSILVTIVEYGKRHKKKKGKIQLCFKNEESVGRTWDMSILAVSALKNLLENYLNYYKAHFCVLYSILQVNPYFPKKSDLVFFWLQATKPNLKSSDESYRLLISPVGTDCR